MPPASITLCIIDMQPFFISSQKPDVIKGVIHQISLAKRRRAGVVLVEYDDCGKTDDRIVNAIGNYDRAITIKKFSNDGSVVILKAIKRERFFSRRHLRLCGVNTAWCIYETAVGLSKKLPNATIQLAHGACNDSSDKMASPRDMLNLFTDVPLNVKVA